MIAASVAPPFEDASVSYVNLARRIEWREDYLDRNTIKVVTNVRGDAVYFSRAPTPEGAFARAAPVVGPQVSKRVCVISFRRDFLHEFASLPQTPSGEALISRTVKTSRPGPALS